MLSKTYLTFSLPSLFHFGHLYGNLIKVSSAKKSSFYSSSVMANRNVVCWQNQERGAGDKERDLEYLLMELARAGN